MFRRLCEICGMQSGTQRHHKFSQTEHPVAHYGRKLIDHPVNVVMVCPYCHASHRNIPQKFVWTEQQFRDNLIAAGVEIPEPMKSYKRGSDG